VFAEHGYDRATLGAIADAAGVHKALIHYHFGGKEQLYREVLDLPVDPWEVISRLIDHTPRADLPQALVRQGISTWRDPENGPRMVVVARHMFGDEDGPSILRHHMETVLIPRFAKALDADEANVAAAFAVLLGILLSDSFLGVGPLRATPEDDLVAMIAPVLESFLLPPR
jgi:AcrR family transcriptional regulator